MNNIEILQWMIDKYDKRGGGYSQKEALKEAIKCMKETKQDIKCSFCNEDDFDLIGLKSHLIQDCEIFENTKIVKKMF